MHVEIWRLLWPILLLTLVQKIGNAFEGLLVSVNNSEELTIMGLCSPYISLITTASYGLGIGVNSMIGRAVGDGSWNTSRHQMERAIFVIVMVCAVSMSVVTVTAMHAAFLKIPELSGLGWRYMFPYLFGSPILLLFTMLISAMRGLGDTKAGMWMTFLAVPVQLLISWKFYTWWGLGALGYGTLLSRLAGGIYGCIRYRRLCRPEADTEAIRKGFISDFLKLVIPVSLSKVVSPAANAAINGMLLSVGGVYVGASGLGGRMEPFFYLPAMAIGNVAVTMVARRKEHTDTGAICRALCVWSLIPTLALSLLAGFGSRWFWQAMTPDIMIREAGCLYWSIVLWAYPMIALEMTMTGILQAFGCGMPALVVTVIRLWGIQFPIAWISVKAGWGAAGIWTGFVLGNLVSLIISVVWMWKKLYKQNKAE